VIEALRYVISRSGTTELMIDVGARAFSRADGIGRDSLLGRIVIHHEGW